MEDLDKTKYEADLASAESEEQKKNITLEFEAQEMKLRRRSLGNIRFIGELYKINMLTGKIMHECIRRLLTETDEESLECLCRLVTTIGQVGHKINIAIFKKLNIFTTFIVNSYRDIPAELILEHPICLKLLNWASNREMINKYLMNEYFQQLDVETSQRINQPGFYQLDNYFAKMQEIVSEKKTSARVRFLMQVCKKK